MDAAIKIMRNRFNQNAAAISRLVDDSVPRASEDLTRNKLSLLKKNWSPNDVFEHGEEYHLIK